MQFTSAEDVVGRALAELEAASDYQETSPKAMDALDEHPKYLPIYESTEEHEKPERAEDLVVEELFSKDTIDAIILDKRMRDAGFSEGSGKNVTPEVKEAWFLHSKICWNAAWNLVKYALSFG